MTNQDKRDNVARENLKASRSTHIETLAERDRAEAQLKTLQEENERLKNKDAEAEKKYIWESKRSHDRVNKLVVVNSNLSIARIKNDELQTRLLRYEGALKLVKKYCDAYIVESTDVRKVDVYVMESGLQAKQALEGGDDAKG